MESHPDEAPIRVMVVDDHPMWRDAVERDLKAAGFDVVGVAADGHQALARFPAARPQVVVLDLKLGAPLVLGGGGAGIQLTQAQQAVDALVARQGVIAPGTPYELATGDKAAILAFLRAGRHPRRPE